MSVMSLDPMSDLPPAALRRGFRPMHVPPPFVPGSSSHPSAYSVPPSPTSTTMEVSVSPYDHYRSAPASPSGGQRGAAEASEAAGGWRSKSMDRIADGSYAAQVVLSGVRSKLQQSDKQQQPSSPLRQHQQAGAAVSVGAGDHQDADRQFQQQQQQQQLPSIHLQGSQPRARGTTAAPSSSSGSTDTPSVPESPRVCRVNSLTAEWPASPIKISAKKNLNAVPSRLQGAGLDLPRPPQGQGSLEFPNLQRRHGGGTTSPLISPELSALNYAKPPVISAQVPSAPELENSQSFISEEGYRSEEGSDYCSSVDLPCDVSLNTSYKSGLDSMIASAAAFGSAAPSLAGLSDLDDATSEVPSKGRSSLDGAREPDAFLGDGEESDVGVPDGDERGEESVDWGPAVEALIRTLKDRPLTLPPPGASPMAREPPLFQVRLAWDQGAPQQEDSRSANDETEGLRSRVLELEAENRWLRQQLHAAARPGAPKEPWR